MLRRTRVGRLARLEEAQKEGLRNRKSMFYRFIDMANKKNPAWADDNRIMAAFSSAESMSDIIRNMGQPLGSASFLNVKNAALRLGLQIPIPTHYTKAAQAFNTIPLEQVLVEHSTYTNRQSLKRKLIKAGLKKNECEVCGNDPEWNGLPLVLQLDHINGVGDDNRIENLRIICPNCHTQTDTFGYRGRKGSVGRPVTL